MTSAIVSYVILFVAFYCFISAMADLARERRWRLFRNPVERATSDAIEHAWERGAILYVDTGRDRRGVYPNPNGFLVYVHIWVDGIPTPIKMHWWTARGELDLFETRRSLSRQLEIRLLAQLERDYISFCRWETPCRMQPPEELHDGQGQIHTNPRGADRSRGRSLEAAEAHAR